MEKENRALQLKSNNRDLAVENSQLRVKVWSKNAELLGVIKQAEELKGHVSHTFFSQVLLTPLN